MRACLVKMRLTLQCCTNVTFPMDFKEKFCFTPFRKCRLKKEVTHYCPLTLLSPALALTQKEANELETIAIKPLERGKDVVRYCQCAFANAWAPPLADHSSKQ